MDTELIRWQVLYEDPHILIANKPNGLMVEPDRNGHNNLRDEVRRYLKSKSTGEIYAQHIHRLDRPVSGIVLFAIQRAVLNKLSEQFAQRQVKKFYQAVTMYAPLHTSATIHHFHRKEKKKAALYNHQVEFSEPASLSYQVKPFANSLYLWDIELHTGKYHQIRAQLASLGCPIIGDVLYGSTQSYHTDAIALHAGRLIFDHPETGQQMVVENEKDWHSTFNV